MKRAKDIWYQNIDPKKWTEEYPRCSMFDQLKNNAAAYPNLPAIEFQGRKYRFKELLDDIEQLALSLAATGIHKGDIVSIITPNVPQGVIMIYALNRIGAVANMIHPLLSTNEIQHFVESTESVAVLILDVIYDKIASITWNMPRNPKIIIAQVSDALPFPLGMIYRLKKGSKIVFSPKHQCIFWKDLIKAKIDSTASLPQAPGNADALAVILYSGGTTGVPKGVMLTNYNMTCYAIQAFEASGMDTIGKRCLGVLPLFHGFGLALCVHTMLCAGTCVYLVPTYDFQKCNALIFKKKLNFLCGVPAFFESLSRYPDIETKDLSFIDCLISGGDVLPPKLQHRINKQLRNGNSKAEIREAYGQTESVTGCCINPAFHNIVGSVGIPCPNIKSKIVEIGSCTEVPTGVDGELCLTGPNLMLGYYKNDAATAQALRKHKDGEVWLHTGDVFCKDENGYLFFRQRLARMIVSAGFNIYLSQVEKVIAQCNIVNNCCAVGLRDKVLGNVVGVYVILNSPIEHQQAQHLIMDFCKQHMADYALPRRIAFVEHFPTTKMGKVDFIALEEMMNRDT